MPPSPSTTLLDAEEDEDDPFRRLRLLPPGPGDEDANVLSLLLSLLLEVALDAAEPGGPARCCCDCCCIC
jgi:hypothetical protein